MAGIGLSKPYFAKYTNTEGAVAYSGGGLMGKYTELAISLDDGGSNILWGDNGEAESDKQFSGGTAQVTTTELEPDVMLPVLGLKKEAVTDSEVTTTEPGWLVFDDDQEIPYLGIGGIVKKKVNGKIKWVAFVLPKVQFSNPGLSAVTQGETVEWQTAQLTASILRSDAEKHRWYQLSTFMDSEEDAEKLIKKFLNIPAAG